MGAEPLPSLSRHRWVLGAVSTKCDYEDAARARAQLGGRVDRSWVVPYTDGGERLGGWTTVLEHVDAPGQAAAAAPASAAAAPGETP